MVFRSLLCNVYRLAHIIRQSIPYMSNFFQIFPSPSEISEQLSLVTAIVIRESVVSFYKQNRQMLFLKGMMDSRGIL